jgi:HPt (histidine-containing phosphotransfer) domain-containing protein
MMFRTLWKAIGPFRRRPSAEDAASVSPTQSETPGVENGILPERMPGINIRDTLLNLNIDPATFKRILQGFHRNNLETITSIKEAFDHAQWDQLRKMAHSLKGSAANIGADKLHLAAKALEGACADETLCPPAAMVIDDLESALREVLESLGALLTATEEQIRLEKMPAKDPARALPAIDQLVEALDLADPERTHQSIRLLRQYLGRAILQPLEEHINDYEYGEALEVLKEIKKQCQIASRDGEADKG